MVSGSESSRETRPRDVPPPVAAWITRSCREALREAERFTLNTVAEKLAAQPSPLQENLKTFIEETIAAQAEVQAARERDRLSTLESVLTKAWQEDIAARVDGATTPLKHEIATLTEELQTLCREMTVLKTHRPDPLPGRQGRSELQDSATAAGIPPTTIGVATIPPAEERPLLNKSLLFSNVTMPAPQASGIPVPFLVTATQFSANPPASGTAAGASREGASAGPIHHESDVPSQNVSGGNPDPGGAQTTTGVDDEKSPNPVGKSRRLASRKGRKEGITPGGYSSPSSSSSSDSESDSESESLKAPTPMFGPRQKRFSVWKPTNHRFRGVCNHRAYHLVDTDQNLDDGVYATTRKRVQYLVVMGEYKFTGVDPIRVISFLARYKEKCANANMTEAMALMALPHLLAPPAKEAYESQRGHHCTFQGIATWAAAVNWLLRTYATNLEIERALTVLRELRQKPGELETKYATSMSTALGRSGDVHLAYERTTLFMEGLTPAIKPLVLQARKDRPRSSFEDTVAHARSHGDALRAQHPSGHRAWISGSPALLNRCSPP